MRCRSLQRVGRQPRSSTPLPLPPPDARQVATMACSQDGAYALLGFESGLCRVYSLKDGSTAGEWSLPGTAPTACAFAPPWGGWGEACAVMVIGHWPDTEGAVASVYTLGPSGDVEKASSSMSATAAAGPCVPLRTQPTALSPALPSRDTAPPHAGHASPRAGMGTTRRWACLASRHQLYTGCGTPARAVAPAEPSSSPFPRTPAARHGRICPDAGPYPRGRLGGRGLAPDAAMRCFQWRRRGFALLRPRPPLSCAGASHRHPVMVLTRLIFEP